MLLKKPPEFWTNKPLGNPGRFTVAQYGMTKGTLADPGWRARMLDGQTVPTQDFAASLITDGFAGLLIRSFAKGTSAVDNNIVLWRWTGEGCRLDVVDDEGRLSRM